MEKNLHEENLLDSKFLIRPMGKAIDTKYMK